MNSNFGSGARPRVDRGRTRHQQHRNRSQTRNGRNNTEERFGPNIQRDFSTNRRGRGNNRYSSVDGRPRHDERRNQTNKNSQGYKKKSDRRFVREHPIGYKALEKLLSSPSTIIVLELLRENSGYFILIDSDNDFRFDLLNLLFEVLAKACTANSSREALNDLLSKTFEKKFSNKLVSLLIKYKDIENIKLVITNLQLVLGTYVLGRPYEALGNTSEIVTAIGFVLSNLNKIECLKQSDDEDCELLDKFEKLTISYSKSKEKFEKLEKTKVKREDMFNDEVPPDDYREISVVPTAYDINSKEIVFLRKNIVEGKYKDADHYLDVQFRLLREDFVRPLRTGIQDYKSGTTNRKIRDIRIYNNVKILQSDIVKKELTHFVQLSLPKRLNIETSKRFMHGNLVCFSNDKFKSIILGQIHERDPKFLRKGIIGIKFEDDVNINFQDTYTVAESRSYFIAYKFVLSALQQIYQDTLPLQDYIINVQKEVSLPGYIDRTAIYDLQPVIYTTMMKASESGLRQQLQAEPEVLNDRLAHVRICYPINYWPSDNELKFDESQKSAFRGALTRELAIIQGPPGTGKTFLGLKLAQVLLHNSEHWKDDDEPCPILVVCYTNHALDQFLEGMLKFTRNIIRVGGRSKSDDMERFTLHSKIRDARKRRIFPQNIHQRSEELRSELSLQELEVQAWRKAVYEYDNIRGILSFNVLKQPGLGIINNFFLLQFADCSLKRWLLDNPENAFESFQNKGIANASIKQDNARGATLEEQEQFCVDSDDDYFEDAMDYLAEEESNRILLVEDDEHVEAAEHVKNLITYDLRLFDIEKKIFELKSKLFIQFEDQIDVNPEVEFDLGIQTQLFNVLSMGLDIKVDDTCITRLEKNAQYIDIWKLDYRDRWMLYHSWVAKLKQIVIKKMDKVTRTFQHRSKALAEMRTQENLFLMREASVVGMTTTGAAQNINVIEDLAPKIVIIEEAAEILEAHIVTSLSSKCEHLILIGDHQQLRPNPTVYELAKRYGLETSLFERMIKNGVWFERLKYQHRMRSSISDVMRLPALYPDLKDAESVRTYPRIMGLKKNLFFIDHKIYERAEQDDNNSHENAHEAELTIALCRHLLLQGYSPDDITILTPYTGQFFKLRKLQRMSTICADVRISVVDNYQGEENNIILLSLVRSNEEGKVGFLSTDNRVCVALSRAKHGLFVIGNMEQLRNSSNLWVDINQLLEQKHAIGEVLTLRCENHPDEIIQVKTSEDIYKKSPEGGCLRSCSSVLPECGHACPKTCHIRDSDHTDVICPEPCPKTLCNLDHPCPKKCGEKCGKCMVPMRTLLPCEHIHDIPCHMDPKDYDCKTPVVKTLPHCQHDVRTVCSSNENKIKCPVSCDTRLDCGHKCRHPCHVRNDPKHEDYKCFKDCTKLNAGCQDNHPCKKRCYEPCNKCNTKVKKILPCGHKHELLCHESIDTFKCQKNCKRTLDCGHTCKKICYEACDQCNTVVTKVADCGHNVKVLCRKPATRSDCTRKCTLTIGCGHPCRSRCCDPCSSESVCQTIVKSHYLCPKGHAITIPCNKNNKVSDEEAWLYCSEPCNKLLDCGHVCVSKCGTCYNGRLHQLCSQPCKKTLVCGHLCKEPCSKQCPPCKEKCTWKCEHSKCMKNCGEPCTFCKEKCERRCRHVNCTNLCGNLCSEAPCKNPCPKKLKCGHSCVGFCGDPCPPLCRECDQEELTEMLFGDEDEDDARFVYLEDCKHCIEASGLENWLDTSSSEIGMKKCPKCQTPIYNNRRFQDKIFEAYKDVEKVKQKYYEQLDFNFYNETKSIINTLNTDFTLGHALQNHIDSISENLGFNKKKMPIISNDNLKQNYYQAQVLMAVVNVVKKSEHKKEIEKPILDLVSMVMKQKQLITQQMINEVLFELRRITIIPIYKKLKSLYSLNMEVIKRCNEISNLLDPTIMFDEALDKKVVQLLKECEKFVGGLGISNGEKRMILQAMGLKQGHWYKCPNGHIYCITECGGAMIEANCPDCGSRIGGTHHQLLSSNAVATEMDGARYSAWSDQTNLANYDINDLQNL